jgi:hypothetical protein
MSRPARYPFALTPLVVEPFRVPNDGLGFGVRKPLRLIKRLVLHVQSGYCVDPAKGLVYGRSGELIGSSSGGDYVRCGGYGGKPGTWYAHRLVWECSKGPIPPELQIDHLDGNKTNNRLSNLDLVTGSVNVRRAMAMGLAPRGEERTDSKLTDALVCEIRGTKGITDKEWADGLGINRKTVKAARVGTTWAHVRCRGRAVAPSSTRRHRRRKTTVKG